MEIVSSGSAASLMLGAWCYAQPRFFAREAPLQTVVTGPFLFITDVPAEVQGLGSELLELERRITAELKLPRLAVPVRIYLFQDKGRYLRYVQQNFPTLQRSAAARRAIFLLRDGAPHIFVHNSSELRGDVRHEFTHALLNTTVHGLPLWLDEGLAVFYEVPNLSGLQAGHVALLRGRLRQGGIMGLDQLATKKELAQMGKLEYAVAWSWVHFLMRGPAEVDNLLWDYLADLRSGAPADQIQTRLAQHLQDPYRSWVNHVNHLDRK